MLPDNSRSVLGQAFSHADYLSRTTAHSLAANKAFPLAGGTAAYVRMAAVIPSVPGITAVATAIARASMWCALPSPGLFSAADKRTISTEEQRMQSGIG